eukprot:CAMPEP_0197840254 /NCGR_PEP_ID=MMETSP1437-20131217/45501_1 /TAXON_ID=49252 ORGANISM="Eucampia antarctica, Strain CCMP1452" /NCGR_SAMPLE_ID=MMETSP1437 /ASSEMBLY_ACC=CAM_ASM_001096 /LENGTH=94 /DNA_ID=CAMNT_0043449837 /DNA_START=136 /DNA_END=420 /DNA_ORIENTATION=-
MSRVDGRKLVGAAFAATTIALGIAQFYLPFMADRDQLRGMFEEEVPNAAKMELDNLMKLELAAHEAKNGGVTITKASRNGEKESGSMWKKMRRD